MERHGIISGEPLPSVMKAVRVHKFGGPDVLQLDTNVPLPTCGAKQVVQPVCPEVKTHLYTVKFIFREYSRTPEA